MRVKGVVRVLKIALIALVSLAVGVAIILFGIAYFVGGEFHDNKAQDAVAPLEQKLQALGGQKLCDSGYAGYGLLSSTTEPWYYSTYRVPNSAIAKKAFFQEATKLGYPLVPIKRDIGDKLDDHPFNSHPDGDTGLGLDIIPNVELSEGCDEGDEVPKGSVSGKQALFEIQAPSVPR